MNQIELLPAVATPAVSSPRPNDLVRRLWNLLFEASEVAVRRHYDAPWERVED